MSETKNIRDHALEFIREGGPAQIHVQGTFPGLLFTDEFIPFDNLGLSSELGFYRLSQFPDAENVSDSSNPETIHKGRYRDPWDAYIWSDKGGELHLLGERHQVADLCQALIAFLERGELDPEVIDEDDPAWGHSQPIAWAVDEAMQFDPERYRDREQVADTIRTAVRDGRITGVTKTSTGRWMFNPRTFRYWLVKEDYHQPGPKPE